MRGLRVGLLADQHDAIEMADRDTKGDLYEYMLGKIASAGQNGQFRTPRHIIQMMVEMTAPTPKDVICDPACGTAGFLIAASEHLFLHHSEAIFKTGASRRRYPAKQGDVDSRASGFRVLTGNLLQLAG